VKFGYKATQTEISRAPSGCRKPTSLQANEVETIDREKQIKTANGETEEEAEHQFGKISKKQQRH
jgi:hypothetical protein